MLKHYSSTAALFWDLRASILCVALFSQGLSGPQVNPQSCWAWEGGGITTRSSLGVIFHLNYSNMFSAGRAISQDYLCRGMPLGLEVVGCGGRTLCLPPSPLSLQRANSAGGQITGAAHKVVRLQLCIQFPKRLNHMGYGKGKRSALELPGWCTDCC